MGFVTVRDVNLHYVQEGTGDDLLLLCGLGDDWTAWGAQIDGFRENYRVTVVDNRGVGQSSLPSGDFTVVDLAEDAAALCDALSISRAHVAGFSMGGAIAQELALRRPGLVRTLTLVGTWCRSDRLFREMIGAASWAAEAAPDGETFLRVFLPLVYSAAVFDDGRIDEFVAAALENPHQQATDAFVRTARACLGHDAADRLSAITAPTLIVVGEQDLLCPPRFSRAIQQRISGAHLVEIPEQAHQPFQEDPNGFDAILAGFLAGR